MLIDVSRSAAQISKRGALGFVRPQLPTLTDAPPSEAGWIHEIKHDGEAFQKRRALIPATGFFEWQKRADGKQPYRFTRADFEPFAFAGLWEFARIGGEDLLSACIIVGEPNPLTGAVHDRMPVILHPEDYDRWLDPSTTTEELRAVLKPFPDDLMKAVPVNRAVNSVKNDNETCIEPVELPEDGIVARLLDK